MTLGQELIAPAAGIVLMVANLIGATFSIRRVYVNRLLRLKTEGLVAQTAIDFESSRTREIVERIRTLQRIAAKFEKRNGQLEVELIIRALDDTRKFQNFFSHISVTGLRIEAAFARFLLSHTL